MALIETITFCFAHGAGFCVVVTLMPDGGVVHTEEPLLEGFFDPMPFLDGPAFGEVQQAIVDKLRLLRSHSFPCCLSIVQGEADFDEFMDGIFNIQHTGVPYIWMVGLPF